MKNAKEVIFMSNNLAWKIAEGSKVHLKDYDQVILMNMRTMQSKN